MAKDKELAKALAAMRSCVEKNCAQAEGLMADLEIAEGLLRIATEMREKSTKHKREDKAKVIKTIKDMRKKVEALQNKAKKAATSASDQMCALEKCKKQWESLSKVKTAVIREKLDHVQSMLGAMESYVAMESMPAKPTPK
jgi:hypothetical protein